MNRLHRDRLYVALLHYPVKNREGRAIASAITSIDIHDIARTARTYGAAGFYVVTPLADQRAFARRIMNHWIKGAGAAYNPDRKEAFSLVRLRADLQQVVTELRGRKDREVCVVATTAASAPGQMHYADFRKALLSGDRLYLLALGTAWGLTDDFMAAADFRLAPIAGYNGYNHLSVRSAAAIMLDRLLGPVE